MVLAAVGFFFGANATKACQAIASPDYELFEAVWQADSWTHAGVTDSIVSSPLLLQLIDNTTLWGGSLLGSYVFNNSDRIFSLSQALRWGNTQHTHTQLHCMGLLGPTECIMCASTLLSSHPPP